MKSFNEKVKAAQHLFYIVLRMFGKLCSSDGRILYYWFYHCKTHIPTEAVLQTAAVSPDIYDFNTFDSDGDGEWTLAEALKCKRSLSYQQFEYADKNQDAKLSFEESRKAVNGISQGQFIALDEDGDGLHSFEEVDQDIAYMDYQQFNQLDLNQDGKLNYAEAQRIFVVIINEG